MDVSANKASCLNVFHLAVNANHKQIKSLNPEERAELSKIANSIFSDTNIPTINNVVIRRIKIKLSPHTKSQETQQKKVSTYLSSLNISSKHRKLKFLCKI